MALNEKFFLKNFILKQESPNFFILSTLVHYSSVDHFIAYFIFLNHKINAFEIIYGYKLKEE